MLQLPHDHGQPMEEILEHMPAAADFETVTEVFRQLGDPSRVRIFWLLCHCEECVRNISACVGMSSPAVSHHLKMLKSSGLIVSRRDGKEVYYRAAAGECARLLHDMIEKLVEIACPLPAAAGPLPHAAGPHLHGADAHMHGGDIALPADVSLRMPDENPLPDDMQRSCKKIKKEG